LFGSSTKITGITLVSLDVLKISPCIVYICRNCLLQLFKVPSKKKWLYVDAASL